jgi:hypothetical protein
MHSAPFAGRARLPIGDGCAATQTNTARRNFPKPAQLGIMAQVEAPRRSPVIRSARRNVSRDGLRKLIRKFAANMEGNGT